MLIRIIKVSIGVLLLIGFIAGGIFYKDLFFNETSFEKSFTGSVFYYLAVYLVMGVVITLIATAITGLILLADFAIGYIKGGLK